MELRTGNLPNVKQGHTLEEYRIHFGKFFGTQKISKLSEDEKSSIYPKLQYWEIKDKGGKIYYYQLPVYGKANDEFNNKLNKFKFLLCRVFFKFLFYVIMSFYLLVATAFIITNFVSNIELNNSEEKKTGINLTSSFGSKINVNKFLNLTSFKLVNNSVKKYCSSNILNFSNNTEQFNYSNHLLYI